MAKLVSCMYVLQEKSLATKQENGRLNEKTLLKIAYEMSSMFSRVNVKIPSINSWPFKLRIIVFS